MPRKLSLLLCLPMFSFLVACSHEVAIGEGPDRLTLSRVEFSDLPGWNEDHMSEALPALARSCHVFLKKGPNAAVGHYSHAGDWVEPCNAVMQLATTIPVGASDDAVRQLVTTWFLPYAAASTVKGEDGLFTGYYEAELRGSTEAGGAFQTPLYGKPDDWVEVDLGLFKSEWHGQKIIGKTSGHTFVPYDDRGAIAHGSLNGRAHPLVWVDDPVDAFFLAVQGSGQVRMTDGSMMRIGFDSTNGRRYIAIGRSMAARGDIQPPVSMQKIRAWIAAHPDQAETAFDLNPSYVFFRAIDGEGPIGAEGLPLTPLRSLAVDPAFVALGTPIWLSTTYDSGTPLDRLFVAQDTGGAIKGVVRADVFWGAGPDAENHAGTMQNKGRYFLLLPRTANLNVAQADE